MHFFHCFLSLFLLSVNSIYFDMTTIGGRSVDRAIFICIVATIAASWACRLPMQTRMEKVVLPPATKPTSTELILITFWLLSLKTSLANYYSEYIKYNAMYFLSVIYCICYAVCRLPPASCFLFHLLLKFNPSQSVFGSFAHYSSIQFRCHHAIMPSWSHGVMESWSHRDMPM